MKKNFRNSLSVTSMLQCVKLQHLPHVLVYNRVQDLNKFKSRVIDSYILKYTNFFPNPPVSIHFRIKIRWSFWMLTRISTTQRYWRFSNTSLRLKMREYTYVHDIRRIGTLLILKRGPRSRHKNCGNPWFPFARYRHTALHPNRDVLYYLNRKMSTRNLYIAKYSI